MDDPSLERHRRFGKRRALKFGLFALVAVMLLSAAVMTLWNWLMPSIFGWRTIGFWQALGLLVLSRILCGRMGGGLGGGRHWRHRMTERWRQMTAEERERFVEGMKTH